MSAVEQKHSLKTELDELESDPDAASLRSKKPEREEDEGTSDFILTDHMEAQRSPFLLHLLNSLFKYFIIASRNIFTVRLKFVLMNHKYVF